MSILFDFLDLSNFEHKSQSKKYSIKSKYLLSYQSKHNKMFTNEDSDTKQCDFFEEVNNRESFQNKDFLNSQNTELKNSHRNFCGIQEKNEAKLFPKFIRKQNDGFISKKGISHEITAFNEITVSKDHSTLFLSGQKFYKKETLNFCEKYLSDNVGSCFENSQHAILNGTSKVQLTSYVKNSGFESSFSVVAQQPAVSEGISQAEKMSSDNIDYRDTLDLPISTQQSVVKKDISQADCVSSDNIDYRDKLDFPISTQQSVVQKDISQADRVSLGNIGYRDKLDFPISTQQSAAQKDISQAEKVSSDNIDYREGLDFPIVTQQSVFSDCTSQAEKVSSDRNYFRKNDLNSCLKSLNDSDQKTTVQPLDRCIENDCTNAATLSSIQPLLEQKPKKPKFEVVSTFHEDDFSLRREEKLYKCYERSFKILSRLNNCSKQDIESSKKTVQNHIEQIKKEWPVLYDPKAMKKIYVHVDLDSFYASCEILKNPAYKDIPIGIGSNLMLANSNYKAREFGVKSGMPGYLAKRLCPQLLIVPANFPRYNYYSDLVMNILSHFDNEVEIYGIDEACLVFDSEKLAYAFRFWQSNPIFGKFGSDSQNKKHKNSTVKFDRTENEIVNSQIGHSSSQKNLFEAAHHSWDENSDSLRESFENSFQNPQNSELESKLQGPSDISSKTACYRNFITFPQVTSENSFQDLFGKQNRKLSDSIQERLSGNGDSLSLDKKHCESPRSENPHSHNSKFSSDSENMGNFTLGSKALSIGSGKVNLSENLSLQKTKEEKGSNAGRETDLKQRMDHNLPNSNQTLVFNIQKSFISEEFFNHHSGNDSNRSHFSDIQKSLITEESSNQNSDDSSNCFSIFDIRKGFITEELSNQHSDRNSNRSFISDIQKSFITDESVDQHTKNERTSRDPIKQQKFIQMKNKHLKNPILGIESHRNKNFPIAANNKNFRFDGKLNFQNVEFIVNEIRNAIHRTTGLTISAGISVCRGLAKFASDINKPNGQYTIRKNFQEFLSNLDVDEVNGIGKYTKEMLEKTLQIRKIREIKEKAHLLNLILREKTFTHLLRLSFGLSVFDRPQVIEDLKTTKSKAREISIIPTDQFQDLLTILWDASIELEYSLLKSKLYAQTVTLRIRKINFESKTIQKKLNSAIQSQKDLFEASHDLFCDIFCDGNKKDPVYKTFKIDLKINQIGIRVSDLINQRHFSSIKSFQGTRILPVSRSCPICNTRFFCEPQLFVDSHVDRCLKKSETSSRNKKQNILSFAKKKSE